MQQYILYITINNYYQPLRQGGLQLREGLAQVAFFDGLEKKLLQKARPKYPH